MTLHYHVDGELVPADVAVVPVRDRGFLYGDAAFETLRAYGGTIFEWDAHATRLKATCAILGLDHGISNDELRERIDATLSANDLEEAYVRLSITRGVQPGKLTPRTVIEPTVVIIVSPLTRGGLEGRPVWDGPASVTMADTERIPNAAVPARAKTHNYLNGILARLEARDRGVDEALMCDAEGRVTEGATSNCFFVTDGVVHTPDLTGPVLPGVTRSVVSELAESAGIPMRSGRYEPADLFAADEVFLTNTTWEVRPVGQVDDRTYEVGPVTDRLADAFREYVERRHYRRSARDTGASD